MKIYTMTATFGKLEHQTLTLQPGLNVISAGNEWGKSTWCAFLTAMLYGLDTRAKSTKHTLADKERYAPWSGSPMSGRMDLNWRGRDITIERRTKGRTPLGDFRAYETHTGIAVPELDGRNCGEMLLGVERSVFLRSGFIRFSDLSVTEDEALRRRLNNLVTTGDENSAADGLADRLKELKNRVRHNRTGLLPQWEAERNGLEEKLRELQRLEEQNDDILRRMDELEDWRMALENHRDALAYGASLEDARKVAGAEQSCSLAGEEYQRMQDLCAALPERETALAQLDQIRRLEKRRIRLPRQIRELVFPREKAPQPRPFPWWIAGAVLMLCGLVWLLFRQMPGLLCCCVGGAMALWDLLRHRRLLDERMALCRREWEEVLSAWDDRDHALRRLEGARAHHRDLQSMARQAKAPEFPDRLTHSEIYTARLLAECLADRQRLENLQGQCRGSMEALGSRGELMRQLEQSKRRIRELEKTWEALNLAQETLNQAAAELQRRFAPRIARRAGELMNRMTEGRYDRLSIGRDLSLQAGARTEDTLHEALWRSDGTMDQLYLSLRLAVAEELLGEAPLVLDDALVRFDDRRLKAAMEILKDEARSRQVILFTCHDREKKLI